jgi:hypothetical protein
MYMNFSCMLECWKYYQKLHRSQNNKNVAKRLESTTVIILLIYVMEYILEIFNPIQLTDVSYCSVTSHLHRRNLHVDELFSTYSTELLKESGSFMSGRCKCGA